MPCPGRSRQEGWGEEAGAHLGPMGGEEEVIGAGQSRMGSCLIPKVAQGDNHASCWVPGGPTCSPRGGLKEQEVKVFPHTEEAELAGWGGGGKRRGWGGSEIDFLPLSGALGLR